MPAARRIRILTKLIGDAGTDLEAARLCDVCAEVTGASGAAIMLMSDDVPRGSACRTDALSELLEALQFEMGEGPCMDAHQSHAPVLEPDLAAPMVARWPAFASAAVAGGARAVFAFPLQIGAVRLGALQLHGVRPWALSDDQHADALVMADVATQAVLVMQSDAPPGTLASALEASGDFQYVVHQASGMVAAQLDVSIGQALIRLRAYAFGNDRSLADVAAAVIGRTLRFNDGGT